MTDITPGALERAFYAGYYHRPGQLFRRLASRGRRLWRRVAPLPLKVGGEAPTPRGSRLSPGLQAALVRRVAVRSRESAARTAAQVAAGEFRFLNETRRLPDPVDWRLSGDQDADPLWRFHLHSHEFLLDLARRAALDGIADCAPRAWALVEQWIQSNSPACSGALDDAWHPFCISRRLPSWLALWQHFLPPAPLADLILSSAYRQAQFLQSNLEHDIGGNHLLENARALALCSAFFQGSQAEHWRTVSRSIVLRELPEQILPHGEHFERSPMYHVQMLEAVLDLHDAFEGADPDAARECRDAAARMASFLEEILHPDGQIPLLGDSAFDGAPDPLQLIRCAPPSSGLCARPLKSGARRCGDYWTWRDEGSFLLLDAGPVGADHLPAHAHSDLTTIEASVGGQRLIVDSGVFAYRADSMRQWCRSTAAHSVLQVDQREQCDTWSRFRMGYRGHPLDMACGQDGEFDWCRVRHDAFRRVRTPVVGRWIACRRGGPWLIVDWAEGRGVHLLENRLHLAPEVDVRRIDDGELELALGDCVWRLGSLRGGRLEVSDGIYSPEFGVQCTSHIVAWSSRTALPATCGWWLAPAGRPGKGQLTGEGRELRLDWTGERSTSWLLRSLCGGNVEGNCSSGNDPHG